MNNIRKIITERLENEKFQNLNEYTSRHTYGFNEGIDKALEVVLNLIPAPRTKADIIKDLESLGWEYHKQAKSYEYKFIKQGTILEIWGGDHVSCYEPYEDYHCNEYRYSCMIPYREYCLIYELLNLEEEEL